MAQTVIRDHRVTSVMELIKLFEVLIWSKSKFQPNRSVKMINYGDLTLELSSVYRTWSGVVWALHCNTSDRKRNWKSNTETVRLGDEETSSQLRKNRFDWKVVVISLNQFNYYIQSWYLCLRLKLDVCQKHLEGIWECPNRWTDNNKVNSNVFCLLIPL